MEPLQFTLDNRPLETQPPTQPLSPNEEIIFNFLKKTWKGLTHDQIKYALRYTNISTFDNRLRSLRKKGYIESKEGPDGKLLWSPKEAKRF